MIDESGVFPFAEKCASAYCGRFNAWPQYDDAVGDACLFLLEHRDQWSKSKNVLKVRVVGELVRRYQNEHGLRRKKRMKRVEIDLTIQPDRDENVPFVDEHRAEKLTIVERALRQPDVADYVEVVADIVSGKYSKKEVARRHRVSNARVSQIFKRFKTVCRRLADDYGVVLVNTRHELPSDDERNRSPLFYA